MSAPRQWSLARTRCSLASIWSHRRPGLGSMLQPRQGRRPPAGLATRGQALALPCQLSKNSRLADETVPRHQAQGE